MMSRLVIFVKAPVPGRVKTRLARDIGEERACQAYRELVGRLLHNLSDLPEVELRHSPDDPGQEVKKWRRGSWELAPQGGGGLGERMANAFRDHFARGTRRVVLIGSDCPAVLPADIRTAWEALADQDLVLGPAVDGGYWLIGLRAPHPELFHGVSWSEATVLQETLKRAADARLQVRLLRELADVDEQGEWERFSGRGG